MQPRRQPAGRYRGRRRLPKLPSRRYAAVVTTAFVGAGVVALGAGAVVPDRASYLASPHGDPNSQFGIEDRLNALDRATRSQERHETYTIEQGAPQVWLLPLDCQYAITTLYAMRWGTFHYGVDLACGYGNPIYAVADGIVVLSRYNGGYGNEVVIDHGKGIQTIYGHASSLRAREGQRVKAGDVVAYVGNTGYSFGNHLHFEVHINGAPVDPLTFMLARGVDIQNRLVAANGDKVII